MAKFDAESPDYDWDAVKDWEKETGEIWKATILPDGKPHYPSRIPSGKNEGLLLKGKKHETWNLLESGEEKAGYKIYKKGKRYYIRPKNQSEKIMDILQSVEADKTMVNIFKGE